MHSHTYSGNPLGCAVALGVLRIFQTQSVLRQVQEKSQWLTTRFQEVLGENPHVGEIRHIGFIYALELVENFQDNRVGYKIYKKALEQGLILRPQGNVIYFNPPLNIKKRELSLAMRRTQEFIKEVLLS